ncbi:MAG: hypothetical protein EAZ85_02690 [Bacteroidetes bacterium]|nr:MAG: hypothetical protein EAZ85_02690 [Bacteroidota bacterium]TAG86229.1 MAG: hypothetical protein EAZ20_13265 [Bacteroidota bacterium]
MKKIFVTLLAFSLCFGIVSAQDEKKEEKKEEKEEKTNAGSSLESPEGVLILPEEGEWGLGISANPFFNYLGNFFNQAGNNQSPTNSFTQNPFNNLALFGKYVKNETTFYRGRFQLNIGTVADKNAVVKNELPAPSTPNYVTDTRTSGNTGILLAFGIEKRRGAGRLQGFYGGEFLIGYAATRQRISYGNEMTNQFQSPISTTDFVNFASAASGTRLKEQKFGNKFMVGLRGFVGVEYFFAAKMSIGAEFGYAFTAITAGKGSTTTQVWDGTANTAKDVKADTYDANYNKLQLGVGLDNLNGNINLLFYF